MESEQYVLGHKSDNSLFVVLTKKKKRLQWEFTDNFEAADKFTSFEDAEKKANEHRCPRSVTRLRPYENAFSDWLQTRL